MAKDDVIKGTHLISHWINDDREFRYPVFTINDYFWNPILESAKISLQRNIPQNVYN